MSGFSKLSSHQSLIAALLFSLPTIARADVDTALTFGSGPTGYRSYAFRADADIFKLPLLLNLDYFLAKATGVNDIRQSGLGLTWDVNDFVLTNYRYSDTNDGTFNVNGNEGGLSFSLDRLWQSDLQTTVDFGYGAFDYTPTAAGRARLANRLTLTQNRSSIGLNQDITPNFSFYVSHDQYKYDKNPKAIALIVIRRTLNTSTPAFTLLGFPDKTNTLGMRWHASKALTLDLSSGKTTTILEQQQKNTRLGVNYHFNDKLSIAAAATRVTSTAVINNTTGATALSASGATYTELTLGWDF